MPAQKHQKTYQQTRFIRFSDVKIIINKTGKFIKFSGWEFMQKVLGQMRKAITDYNMISEGDRIAVGLSGGKDSIALLCIMAGIKRFYPKKFDLCAITIDMGFDYDKQEKAQIQALCDELGVEWIIEKTYF